MLAIIMEMSILLVAIQKCVKPLLAFKKFGHRPISLLVGSFSLVGMFLVDVPFYLLCPVH
jgi:hypothetical protein